MAKKLTPDVITWSLKINGSDAQKEMRNLQDSSKELKKQQDALRKSMTDLAAQGRKGSEEWKRLDSALKENRKELETNRQKMEALTQRMNLNEMTAGQLEKRLKTLKKELKDTSRATEPERWKNLTAEIKRTEQAMHGASGSTGLFAGALQKLGGMRTAVIGFVGGLAVAAGTALVSAFRQAIGRPSTRSSSSRRPTPHSQPSSAPPRTASPTSRPKPADSEPPPPTPPHRSPPCRPNSPSWASASSPSRR